MTAKGKIIKRLKDIIDIRIDKAKASLIAARESRDSETKSSMGDKYETGREMIQMEMDKLQDQLDKANKLTNAISKIDPSKTSSSAEFGSLVITNHGKYMISIGLGEVEVDKEKYFAISLASPIGQELEGKRIGDKVVFQGREIVISEIL